MTRPTDDRKPATSARRARVIAVILALQALAAVFFIADVARDLAWGGLTVHSGFEAVVAIALVVGTGLGALQLRDILHRMRRAEAAASIASGAFIDLIDDRFREWGLTPAEAEVALFTLKGLGPPEIADLRNAAQGTVRAQLARIYAKAGVTSRGELSSHFIEDLLAEPLTRDATAAAPD